MIDHTEFEINSKAAGFEGNFGFDIQGYRKFLTKSLIMLMFKVVKVYVPLLNQLRHDTFFKRQVSFADTIIREKSVPNCPFIVSVCGRAHGVEKLPQHPNPEGVQHLIESLESAGIKFVIYSPRL